MTQADAIQLLKCLADKSRLQILKSLTKEDMYAELLAERLGLTPATISFHVKKLMDAGLLRAYKTQYYTMYSLCMDPLHTKIIDLICETSDEESLQQREHAYRQRVINSFFEYGKLKSIPVQQKKKRIILEEISKSFVQGHIYSEQEVTTVLKRFHEDYCTLRRDLVGERLMERNSDGYWLL